MLVCDFFSDLTLLDSATHYRSQENGKDKPGPVSMIAGRKPCPHCGRTAMISTDSGITASFATRHIDCLERALSD